MFRVLFPVNSDECLWTSPSKARTPPARKAHSKTVQTESTQYATRNTQYPHLHLLRFTFHGPLASPHLLVQPPHLPRRHRHHIRLMTRILHGLRGQRLDLFALHSVFPQFRVKSKPG